MINKYIIAALSLIFVVSAFYFYNFYIKLDYAISGDTAVWGQIGDYFGGILNPILSFISMCLLIKSLRLQNEANESLRKELINSEKTEKIRSFETLFFNMIDSQKMSFGSFNIKITIKSRVVVICGAEAVIKIEENIENLRKQNQNNSQINKYLKKIDSNDQIYGATRIFYITVKMITEKSSDDNGFCEEDRKSHLLTLINFTDYTLLRLIMISIQFMDWHPTKYLINNNEFNAVLKDIGINYDLY